ncbi:hypothetical protein LTR66_006720 [Elasticomyces elasticus]|nr:hypothetical protein LTR66_006720 [Elasticomyces elasticus]
MAGRTFTYVPANPIPPCWPPLPPYVLVVPPQQNGGTGSSSFPSVSRPSQVPVLMPPPPPPLVPFSPLPLPMVSAGYVRLPRRYPDPKPDPYLRSHKSQARSGKSARTVPLLAPPPSKHRRSKSYAPQVTTTTRAVPAPYEASHPKVPPPPPPPTQPFAALTRTGEPFVVYHICLQCRRPRSVRYHREHPVPLGLVPPPPGICRRCRDAETDHSPHSRRDRNGYASGDEQREFVKGVVTEACSPERPLKGRSRSVEYHTHRSRYRHTRHRHDRSRSQSRAKAGRGEDRRGRERSREYGSRTVTRRIIETEDDALPAKTNPQDRCLKYRHVKTRERSPEDSGDGGEKSAVLHKQRTKLKNVHKRRTPSEDDIRRIARQEVESYRKAEKSMEEHPRVFSYGHVVKVNEDRNRELLKPLKEKDDRRRPAQKSIDDHPRAFNHGKIVPASEKERQSPVDEKRPLPPPLDHYREVDRAERQKVPQVHATRPSRSPSAEQIFTEKASKRNFPTSTLAAGTPKSRSPESRASYSIPERIREVREHLQSRPRRSPSPRSPLRRRGRTAAPERRAVNELNREVIQELPRDIPRPPPALSESFRRDPIRVEETLTREQSYSRPRECITSERLHVPVPRAERSNEANTRVPQRPHNDHHAMPLPTHERSRPRRGPVPSPQRGRSPQRASQPRGILRSPTRSPFENHHQRHVPARLSQESTAAQVGGHRVQFAPSPASTTTASTAAEAHVRRRRRPRAGDLDGPFSPFSTGEEEYYYEEQHFTRAQYSSSNNSTLSANPQIRRRTREARLARALSESPSRERSLSVTFSGRESDARGPYRPLQSPGTSLRVQTSSPAVSSKTEDIGGKADVVGWRFDGSDAERIGDARDVRERGGSGERERWAEV